MKATLWLWSLVTVLACVSQRVSAGPYTDTRIVQQSITRANRLKLIKMPSVTK
ncbi:hypothetical protein pipiens_019256, partial [Culex pipiens pipiens]